MSESNNISDYDLSLINEYFKDEESRETAKKRLSNREPLAYIIGEWGFYDQIYKVSPDCLIPRPDTEHLVDELIKRLPKGGLFLDLCTGSGCIAISSLVHRKDASAVAVDISSSALEIAKENAGRYNVSDRLSFICSDVNELEFSADTKFDIIVSNPPYIETDVIETLEPELFFEPHIALDGGADGLDFYRLIVGKYNKYLKPHGTMIFEIGWNQADALRNLGAKQIIKDYGGNDRVAVIPFD